MSEWDQGGGELGKRGARQTHGSRSETHASIFKGENVSVRCRLELRACIGSFACMVVRSFFRQKPSFLLFLSLLNEFLLRFFSLFKEHPLPLHLPAARRMREEEERKESSRVGIEWFPEKKSVNAMSRWLC